MWCSKTFHFHFHFYIVFCFDQLTVRRRDCCSWHWGLRRTGLFCCLLTLQDFARSLAVHNRPSTGPVRFSIKQGRCGLDSDLLGMARHVREKPGDRDLGRGVVGTTTPRKLSGAQLLFGIVSVIAVLGGVVASPQEGSCQAGDPDCTEPEVSDHGIAAVLKAAESNSTHNTTALSLLPSRLVLVEMGLLGIAVYCHWTDANRGAIACAEVVRYPDETNGLPIFDLARLAEAISPPTHTDGEDAGVERMTAAAALRDALLNKVCPPAQRSL